MKRLRLLSLFLLASVTVFAQVDSTTVATVASALPPHYKAWLLGAWQVYELIIRYFPTVKSYSLNGFLIRLYQLLVPNRNAATPTKPHA